MSTSPSPSADAVPEKPDPEAKKRATPAENPSGKDSNVPAVIKEVTKQDIVPAKPAPPPKIETPPPPAVRPPAQQSDFQLRHFLVLLSFLIMVIVPSVVSAWYLWSRSADQYASYVGFSVRAEDQSSAIASLLGPLQLGSGSTAPDAEVLYQFIQSQDLASAIDKKLDLRSIWSKGNPAIDPVFSYHPPGTVEDLLNHWGRKVYVIYDAGTGLIELRILAFTPEDAQKIAQAIFAQSTAMINELSDIAREDSVSYAREELDTAVERLKTARTALTAFRNRTQIVDPSIDLQGQAALLNTLNGQLAEALIEQDLLRETTRAADPRIAQAERRIRVIRARIVDEKRKLGIADDGTTSEAFATLVGEYERLQVDREFAEQTYIAALAAFDAAQAEARRQTRYLAAHVRPTLAEKSEYPKRFTLFGLIVLFSFLLWAIITLIAYSLRDRR